MKNTSGPGEKNEVSACSTANVFINSKVSTRTVCWPHTGEKRRAATLVPILILLHFDPLSIFLALQSPSSLCFDFVSNSPSRFRIVLNRIKSIIKRHLVKVQVHPQSIESKGKYKRWNSMRCSRNTRWPIQVILEKKIERILMCGVYI